MEKISHPYRSSFLKQQAKEAWSYFNKIGYPKSKNENWKFSNINKWILKKRPIIKENKCTFNDQSKFSIKGTYSVHLINDSIIYSDQLPFDVEIFNLNEYNDEIRSSKIGSVVNYENSPFLAENMALFKNCYFLNVPENTIIEKPIHIINDIVENCDSSLYSRLFINVGRGSKVNFIQTELGSDNYNHYINSVIEIILNKNATLDYSLVQKRNLHSAQVSSFNILLAKNASANYNTFEFGTGFLRRDVNANFNSADGDFNFNSLFISTGSQHMDISSIIHHKNEQCNSSQFVKGVLSDKSSGVFRGLTHVYKGASKTDAKQSNHNLLLSKKSKINSIPQLKILEDDVKCSHGSTTGQIDEDALFYLQSRGITRHYAMELLVLGFINELNDKLDFLEFKNIINNELKNKMKDIII